MVPRPRPDNQDMTLNYCDFAKLTNILNAPPSNPAIVVIAIPSSSSPVPTSLNTSQPSTPLLPVPVSGGAVRSMSPNAVDISTLDQHLVINPGQETLAPVLANQNNIAMPVPGNMAVPNPCTPALEGQFIGSMTKCINGRPVNQNTGVVGPVMVNTNTGSIPQGAPALDPNAKPGVNPVVLMAGAYYLIKLLF